MHSHWNQLARIKFVHLRIACIPNHVGGKGLVSRIFTGIPYTMVWSTRIEIIRTLENEVLQLGLDLIRSLACGTASGSRSNYACTINLGQTGSLGECQLRRKHIVKQALEYVHNVPPKPIYLVEVHDNLVQTISNILCWICLFTAVGLLRQPPLLFSLKLKV